VVDYARRRPEESPLYEVVRAGLETFLSRAREQDRVVPRFVERELYAYLACGILAYGFVRVRCDACGCERLVPSPARAGASAPPAVDLARDGDVAAPSPLRTRHV
jgi:hypothetical protein